MKIYLKSLDLDVWKSVENGVIEDKFDKQTKEEIMRGLSKSNIEKLIYFDTSK